MIQKFIRYILVGVSNTVMDFGLYIGLTRGFTFWKEHYLIANAVTFSIVVTWSFFVNKHWTFREPSLRHFKQYVKFLTVTMVGMGIAQGVLWGGVELFSLPDLFAKIIAGPFVVAWNFSMHRRWTFG